jgi:hypothetical protein
MWSDLFAHIGAGDPVLFMWTNTARQFNPNATPWNTYHSAIVHRKSNDDPHGRVSMAQNSEDGWRNLRDVSRQFVNPNGEDFHWIIVIRIRNTTTW